VNEQPEDSSKAESADTRLSSFSSSLGPQRSAQGNAAATGPSGSRSAAPDVPAATSVADPRAAGGFGSAKTQVTDRVSEASATLASLSLERPEVVIAAAFVGGVLIATILKRLAR